jgi:hypothetical protein
MSLPLPLYSLSCNSLGISRRPRQRQALGGGIPAALCCLGMASLLFLSACHSDDRDLGAEAGGRQPGSMAPTGPGPSLPPDYMPPMCKKVDILFVIDDSGSMADNQASLIRSFPGFVDGMRRKLAGAQDYHIGVVTSDDYYFNGSGCGKIGSLITKTGGPKSSNMNCGPLPGPTPRRYLTSEDTDLKQRFACMAQVGAGGADDERMARGLLNAISPSTHQKGGCNEGFLRPDSLLIIVLITDEDDVPDQCEGGVCATNGSGGTPDDWFAEFKKYRPNTDGVVVLSLLGRRGDNPCGAVPASRLMRFTNLFKTNGYLGDICASSYDAFFEAALPLIGSVCGMIPG